jgi:hypothetical protein
MAEVEMAEDTDPLIVRCTQVDCDIRGTRRENEESVFCCLSSCNPTALGSEVYATVASQYAETL